jgi:hypothetical protein
MLTSRWVQVDDLLEANPRDAVPSALDIGSRGTLFLVHAVAGVLVLYLRGQNRWQREPLRYQTRQPPLPVGTSPVRT